MTIESRPEPGRPVMTAREAARVLRRDPRTIKRMIQTGELAGGADSRGQRRQWYVYTDQIQAPAFTRAAAEADSGLRAENQRLRDENADLHARLISSEESYRLVLASQSTMREALADYQRSVDDLLAGTDAFREAAVRFQSAAAGLQSSNTKLNATIGSYSDALHQHVIPGHAGSLVHDPAAPLPPRD